MVTIAQVQNGLMKYLDAEILPHLTGATKVGVGIFAALASRNIAQYANHPAVAMLNVIDGNGMVDIDAIYSAAMPMFATPQKISIPVVGDFTFDQSDVEKLRRYMEGNA